MLDLVVALLGAATSQDFVMASAVFVYVRSQQLDTPRQKCHHVADDTFKYILFNENVLLRSKFH